MGFFQKLAEQNKIYVEKQRIQMVERRAKEKEALILEKERLARMDAEGIPYCPKCHSASVTAVKKGFGLGKALVGGVLLGPVGLLGGAIGKNKISLYCMKCGNKFKA